MDMIEQLFGDERYDIVEYSDIATLSFDRLAKSRNLMSLENIETIHKFYKPLYGTLYKSHCDLNPFFNYGVNCMEYRFLLIRHEGMLWLWAYKVIQILKTKQIRFFDIPCDVSGCGDVRDIVRNVMRLPFTRFVFQGRFCDIFTVCTDKLPKRLKDYDDYFFRIDHLAEKFTKRYLYKRYISQCFANKNVSVVNSETASLDAIGCLLQEWCDGMNKRGHGVVEKNKRQFVRFLSKKRSKRCVYNSTLPKQANIISSFYRRL